MAIHENIFKRKKQLQRILNTYDSFNRVPNLHKSR